MDADRSEFDKKAKQLAEQIRALQPEERANNQDGSKEEESQAVRLVSDFSAAALVGAGLGYACDAWLESAPWGLIVGLCVGVAAGTRRMLQQEK
jgi:ATP synthase protein I